MKKITTVIILMCVIVIPDFIIGQTLAWYKTNSQTASVFNNIYFADNNTGWAFGDSVNGPTFVKGIIKKTTNQGGIWSMQNMGSNAIQIFSGCALNTSTVIAVGRYKTVGNGAVIRSSDGGLSWTRDTTSIPEPLYDVSFPLSGIGWAVGKNGYIGKSINGGATWSAQTSSVTVPLNSVAFVDANNGWAVGVAGGPGGTILHTTNGGTTYSTQTDPLPGDLFGVAAINANRAVAVGQGGKLILTTDGGATWTAKNSGVTQDLFDVSFPTPANGWAVGTGGVMIFTTDSGSTWSPQVSGVTSNINSIHMKSASLGWYCGDAGNIYFYGPGPASVKSNNPVNLLQNLYPNPASSVINIKYESSLSSKLNVEITDVFSKSVIKFQCNNISDEAIDISELKPGVYFISLMDNNSNRTIKKFIKE